MIKQALGTELNADIDLNFSAGGLICTVTAPTAPEGRCFIECGQG